MASQPVAKWMPNNGPKRSPELIAEILTRVANGENYTAIWKSDKSRYPHPVNWIQWRDADPELSLAHASIKELQADAVVQDALEIIDTEPDKVATKEGLRWDTGHITWLKNRADMRMKRAAQIAPHVYGEKTLHAGHDGGSIKTETVAALPSLMERLRSVRKAGGTAAEAVIDQPAVTPADPSPVGQEGTRPLEPGDPGMEFV